MKRSFMAIVMGITCGATGMTGTAFGDDCDSAFKDVEAYLCKHGRVEHKVGLKKDTRTECVELKKLQINSCEVEGVTTSTDIQEVYFLGNAAQKNKFASYDWQCDEKGGSGQGGMSKGGFSGYMHPDYTIAKFPGESNSDRQRRFTDDLAKEGKVVLGSILISNPVSKYNKKFDKQTCQYFDPKTNKVALRFNCTVDFAGEPAKGSGSSGGANNGAQKGLKKLFGF